MIINFASQLQVLSDETDNQVKMGVWLSIDPLIESTSSILVGLQKLNLSSMNNSEIQRRSNEIEKKLAMLKKTIKSSIENHD